MCERRNDLQNGNNEQMRYGDHRGCCGRHEHRGRHEHCGCHGEHGHHRGRCHDRAAWEEMYLSMDNDGKLGVLLHDIHRMSRFFFENRGGQRRILHILAHEGDMTQRALTERLGIQPGSASELIGKLERAGFITRTESAEDRRTADVHLTESGMAQLEAGRQKKPELFDAMSGDEKEQLVALLEKLRASWREKIMQERPVDECRPMKEDDKPSCGDD